MKGNFRAQCLQICLFSTSLRIWSRPAGWPKGSFQLGHKDSKKQLTDANITGNARRCDLSCRTSLPHARPIRFFYVFRWPKHFSAHLSPRVSFLLGKAPPRFRQLPFRGRHRGFLIRVCLMLAKVFFILNFFPESALWKDLACHLERVNRHFYKFCKLQIKPNC